MTKHQITKSETGTEATCECGWSTAGTKSHVREMSADHRFTTGASRAVRGARVPGMNRR